MNNYKLATTAAVALLSPAVYAGYGTIGIGYGGESYAMAGADVARADSGLGASVNPAGLSRIEQGNLGMYGEVFHFTGWEHQDDLGNDQRVTQLTATAFGFGFGQRLSDNLVAGVVMMGQGGIGLEHKDLLTSAGNRDELSTMVGVFRISPSIAWQYSPALSLGASMGLNYSSATQKIFPNTSIAPDQQQPGFPGMKLDGMESWTLSYRLGMLYELNQAVTLGLAYGSKTKIHLDGGDAVVNYEAFDAFGNQRVRYRNAELKGLALPQELVVGASWQVSERWELAAEIVWLDWSKAMAESELRVSDPQTDNQNVQDFAANIVAVTPMKLKDHYPVAIAARYQLDDKSHLMGGISYAKSPLPPENAAPLFAIMTEVHLTAGYSRRLDDKWTMVATTFYIPENEVNYQNKGLPLGNRAREKVEGWDFTFTLERDW